MSPTASLVALLDGHDGCVLGAGRGGVPGVGIPEGGSGGLYRYPVPTLVQDPYLVIFSLMALPTAK